MPRIGCESLYSNETLRGGGGYFHTHLPVLKSLVTPADFGEYQIQMHPCVHDWSVYTYEVHPKHGSAKLSSRRIDFQTVSKPLSWQWTWPECGEIYNKLIKSSARYFDCRKENTPLPSAPRSILVLIQCWYRNIQVGKSAGSNPLKLIYLDTSNVNGMHLTQGAHKSCCPYDVLPMANLHHSRQRRSLMLWQECQQSSVRCLSAANQEQSTCCITSSQFHTVALLTHTPYTSGVIVEWPGQTRVNVLNVDNCSNSSWPLLPYLDGARPQCCTAQHR